MLRYFIITLLFLSACSGKDPNEDFMEKYGKDIEAMRMQKAPGGNTVNTMSTIPSQLEVMRDGVRNTPYVDVTRLGEKLSKNYLPNAEIYDLSAPIGADLPPDVFEIRYNLAMHPPFRRIGFEFDNIQIPEQDAFGVKTAFADKAYQLLGGKIAQNTLDRIHANKKSYDNEISEILISERKEAIRRKQMQEIFGAYEIKVKSEEEEEIIDSQKAEEAENSKQEEESNPENTPENNAGQKEEN